MFFYNSLSKKYDAFLPINDRHVGMYVCGPTVYDRAHLGNARSAVVFDVLYRTLAHRYSSVSYVRNFTDVDDKINNAAKKRHPELHAVDAIRLITDRTIDLYHNDMDFLKVLRPTHEPRASDYIAEMQDMISVLIDRGHAYTVDSTVFFAVSTTPENLKGILSNRKQDSGRGFERVLENKLKTHKDDFVLWKPSEAGDPAWSSPWGAGRPGWHIECSAMSKKLLGEEFDIHGGGEDLMFPHHENEIAQSGSSCNHKPHARYWLHNGMVLINGKKMSKSLGNFLTVDDVSSYMTGEEIRLALIGTHYRGALNWNENLVEQTKNVWKKFSQVPKNDHVPSEDFLEALYSDLNTPLALSILHKEIKNQKPTAYPALKLLGLRS
jgi:cysteinyl-tRNA synthetase